MLEYGEHVKVLAGKYRHLKGCVGLPVHNRGESPYWIQVWPQSGPDEKRGYMEVVSLCEENVRRLSNGCGGCETGRAPEGDYLCRECRHEEM